MGLRVCHLIPGLFALLLSANAVFAEGNNVDFDEPQIIQQSLGRDFGLLVGDKLKHHYRVDVPEEFSLSPASLPSKGEVNYWLKIDRVSFKELGVSNHRRQYQLDITFQTFYAPLDVRILFTPAISVSFYHGNKERKLDIPAWGFSMSPLKESSASGGQSRSFMKPDLDVLAIDTQSLVIKVYVQSVLLIALIFAWLTVTGRLFNSVSSPFQVASKRIRFLKLKGNTADVEQGIQFVHQAFNAQASHAVFSHQIDDFIEKYPEFSANKQSIDSFYELSTEVLYGNQRPSNEHYTLLLDVCRSMAKSEKLALKK